MHVHPDRLTTAHKEALGNHLFNKITTVNCVLDAALLNVGDGKAVVAYLDSLPPDPRASTACLSLSTACRGSDTPRLHRVTTEGTLSTTPMTAHFPTRAAIRRRRKAHLACARCLPCLSRPLCLPRALSRSKVCQRAPLVPLSRPYPERRVLIPMLGLSRGRAWGAARRRVCARTASNQPRCL